MNFTINEETSDCVESDIKFYISLGINGLLGILTIVSEILPHSKCKSNGITDHIVKQITKDLSNVQEQINKV